MSDARIDGYARALFEVARAEGTLDEVEDELFRFARSFESSDELRTALTNELVREAIAHAIGDEVTPEDLTRQTFLIHNELPESFAAWKKANDLDGMEPAAIDHYDSGQLMLEAAAQGLGIAIMHDDHLGRLADNRLTTLGDKQVESPYSYWFVCKPTALESRPVRLFHDWLVRAGL